MSVIQNLSALAVPLAVRGLLLVHRLPRRPGRRRRRHQVPLLALQRPQPEGRGRPRPRHRRLVACVGTGAGRRLVVGQGEGDARPPRGPGVPRAGQRLPADDAAGEPAVAPAGVPRPGVRDLRAARKAGALAGSIDPQRLAAQGGRSPDSRSRRRLLDAEWQALDALIASLNEAKYSALAQFLALRPHGEMPMLVVGRALLLPPRVGGRCGPPGGTVVREAGADPARPGGRVRRAGGR